MSALNLFADDVRWVEGRIPRIVGWVTMPGARPKQHWCDVCEAMLDVPNHKHVLKPCYRNGEYMGMRVSKLPLAPEGL